MCTAGFVGGPSVRFQGSGGTNDGSKCDVAIKA